MMLKKRKTVKKNLRIKILAHLVVLILFCFITGCAHTGGGKPDKTTDDSPRLEAADAELNQLAGSEPEDDDAFFEDEEGGLEDDDDFFEDDEFDVQDLETEKKLVADPLYYFNKSMYHFNDKLYFWFMKPVANTYKAVTPTFFRTGVRNFFDLVATPVRFTSCLLQGKIKGAGTEIGRLLINVTLGFGGVIDTAKHSFKLDKADEDLGQVLGSYGIGNGFYLYLPLTGPTTLRDSIGSAGGYFLDPMLYMENRDLALALSGFSTINKVSFMIGNYEAVKSASLDPYSMIRDFYIEQRKKKIKE